MEDNCDSSISEDLGLSSCGRSKKVSVFRGSCDRCGKGGPVISTDSSDEEYGSIDLCIECIHDFFSLFEQQTKPSSN